MRMSDLVWLLFCPPSRFRVMETIKDQTGANSLSSAHSSDILTLTIDQPADPSKRVIAFAIDIVFAAILWQIPVLGKVLGLTYFLIKDGLEVEFMKGRSLGKKLMGLQPVRIKNQPMDISASIKRNWIFVIAGVASFLRGIPLVGWLIVLVSVILGILAALYEIYLVVNNPEGRRWGDIFAGTRVIEAAE